MNRRIPACLILLAALLSAPVFGAENEKAKTLPFYFPKGVIQTADPVKQIQEYIRYLTATCYRFQGNHHNPHTDLIPGSDSIVIPTDIDSTSYIGSDKPEKCKIVLDHFVRMSDGRVRVTQLADQFFITEEELKVAADDLTAIIRQASESDYEFWKDISSLAFKARAQKIFTSAKAVARFFPPSSGVTQSVTASSVGTAAAIAEFGKLLDRTDPLSGVTLREINGLPAEVRPSDFVPRELHLGYNPKIEGILGVCWLNTGVIYYNPQARIMDYLTGRPKVLQHEMVHCNHILEKFPLSSGFDAELFAMFPEIFLEENKYDLFFHHYANELREICEAYFGFDFAEAKNQMFKYDLAGSVIIDEVKFREYSAKLEVIKKELSRAFREYIIPEFYSNSLWWSAMHDKLADPNGLFWIMMARHYRPTILGSARETAVWLSAHREEIMEMAKSAYENVNPSNGQFQTFGKQISPALANMLAGFLYPEDRELLNSYFERNPQAIEKLSKMNIGQAAGFIRSILEKEEGVRELEE